jgi:cytochrome P450
MTRADVPSLDLDLWSEEVLYDPWPHYRAIRDAGPAVHLVHELYDVYAVGRYEDARDALRHWELFSSAQGVGFNDLMNEAMQGTIVGADPPEHDMLRGVMLERLKLSEVRELSIMVQGKADALVAELLDRGEFDAVFDLAERLVPTVVGQLVGISGEVLDKFAHGGDKFFTVAGPPNEHLDEGFPVVLELLQLIGSLTKADMARGSMGWDLYDAAERGEIPEDMCTTLLWNYVGPGFDTTINAIGSTIWMLARDPEQWKALKADPSLVPGAVNEGIRMESPIQIWSRWTTRDADVDGVTVPEGSRVAILLGSANRDERHYPEPDRFDVHRNPADHVAFGHGIHLCVGAPLARAEVAATLNALVQQVSTLECGEPVRRVNNTTRGLERLPVSVS